MNILIITQSSSTGVNQSIALDCEHIIMESLTSVMDSIDIKIMNCNQVTTKDIDEANKMIMIVPEWNGSFPFMFKELVDNSGYPSNLRGKDILLIGTSNTSFGNIIGINQLQYILSWVGAKVFDKKVYVPNLDKNGYVEQRTRVTDAILKFVI